MRVTLNGHIVGDDYAWIYEFFGYSVISPAKVRQAIKDNPVGEELVLEINSTGGSVFAGFEMYSALRSAKEMKTRAEVQSIAASAASTMMLGCDEVWISPVAQVMIHLPSTYTEGDRTDHKQSIHILDSITDSILNGYEAKVNGKRTRDQLRKMMDAETWLTAQEALDAGLVDGILFQDDSQSIVPSAIVNAVGSGMRALAQGGGLPDPEHLMAQYRAMEMARLNAQTGEPAEEEQDPIDAADTGGVPAADNRNWQADAQLALEKIRF